jgi:hypothetical protein
MGRFVLRLRSLFVVTARQLAVRRGLSRALDAPSAPIGFPKRPEQHRPERPFLSSQSIRMTWTAASPAARAPTAFSKCDRNHIERSPYGG